MKQVMYTVYTQTVEIPLRGMLNRTHSEQDIITACYQQTCLDPIKQKTFFDPQEAARYFESCTPSSRVAEGWNGKYLYCEVIEMLEELYEDYDFIEGISSTVKAQEYIDPDFIEELEED